MAIAAHVASLFPERFEIDEHPRKTIRESIYNRLKNPVGYVDSAQYPENYDTTLQPGDEGYVAPVPVPKYWTPAGPNVFARKEIEIRFQDMPLILIRFGDEKVIERSVAGWDGYDKRILELFVESYVVVSPDKSGEDLLDEMAFFIEASMNGFELNQFTTDVNLAETEQDLDFDTAQPVAVGRLTFQVSYLCPKLGVDFGLWDRDGACIINNGPNPSINPITVSSNFGDEVFLINP